MGMGNISSVGRYFSGLAQNQMVKKIIKTKDQKLDPANFHQNIHRISGVHKGKICPIKFSFFFTENNCLVKIGSMGYIPEVHTLL